LSREFQSGDLRGSLLVYVAADGPDVIHSAADEARALGIPINVVDNPAASTFISPAILKRGDLQVAISTGGASPALARLMRQRLERQIGPQYELLLEIMRRARHFVRVCESDQRARAAILNSLAAVLLDSVETLDCQMINDALRLFLHAKMAELGFDPHDGVIGGAGAPARDDKASPCI
jgi:siroheme synthase-like protein